MSSEMLLVDFMCEISQPIITPLSSTGPWYHTVSTTRHWIAIDKRTNRSLECCNEQMNSRFQHFWWRTQTCASDISRHRASSSVTLSLWLNFQRHRASPRPKRSTCICLEPSIDFIQATWSVYLTVVRKFEGSCNKKSCDNKSWFVAILSMN